MPESGPDHDGVVVEVVARGAARPEDAAERVSVDPEVVELAEPEATTAPADL